MNKVSVAFLMVTACAAVAVRVEAANGWHRKPTLPVATHADVTAARHAQTMSWHGPYAHTWYGMPVSLVVPPTAHMQTNWGWGVSQGSMTPIYHQFRRNYPGDFTVDGGAYGYAPTPRWPSHTSQFGVYYVRAPY